LSFEYNQNAPAKRLQTWSKVLDSKGDYFMSKEQELFSRVEKLEKQNRLMRMAMLVLCVFLAMLFTMAQTLPKKNDNYFKIMEAETITAQEIILQNAEQATTVRITPGMLTFRNAPAKEGIAISASGISLSGKYVAGITSAGLKISSNGVSRLDFSMGESGSSLLLFGKNGDTVWQAP
jgi:hypothetical protein